MRQVLQGTSEAMTAKELTRAAINQGFISTTGKVSEPLRVCHIDLS